jgi:hypothetical protein
MTLVAEMEWYFIKLPYVAVADVLALTLMHNASTSLQREPRS